MKKAVLFCLLTVLLWLPVQASENTPKGVIISLFDAMRAGDKEKLLSLWDKDGQLRRVTDVGSIKGNGLPRWSDWVGTLSDGDADEQIFDVVAHEFGNLATVWAPFKIEFKGKLVGCGVNTFILAKGEDKKWKIISGMDTNHKGDCTDFINIYRKK